MTLQDIADDAGVTPALVNRYFVSKRALFDLVAQSHTDEVEPLTEVGDLAADLMTCWQDVDRGTPALALVRSIDLDGGELLKHEPERRIRGPWRDLLVEDPEAEAEIRLLESLTLGLGLFGIGALLGEEDGPTPEALTVMERRLALMIEACLGD